MQKKKHLSAKNVSCSKKNEKYVTVNWKTVPIIRNMRCLDLDTQSVFLFIQRGVFEKEPRSPPSSILHLKGLFKWPRAAIDFRTLISLLHYEEFCYLHLRPVFLPPSTPAPPCGLHANPPSHRRYTNPQRAHMHVLLLSHGREPQLTEDQTAPWAARWQRRQMEEQMLDSGHKIKSRQDFKERWKKTEMRNNLKSKYACENAPNSWDAEKFSTSWLSIPVSRPGNFSRLRHRLTWILWSTVNQLGSSMLTHDKGVRW